MAFPGYWATPKGRDGQVRARLGHLEGTESTCTKEKHGCRMDRKEHGMGKHATGHPIRDLFNTRGGGLLGGAHPSTFGGLRRTLAQTCQTGLKWKILQKNGQKISAEMGPPRGGRLGHPPYPPPPGGGGQILNIPWLVWVGLGWFVAVEAVPILGFSRQR